MLHVTHLNVVDCSSVSKLLEEEDVIGIQPFEFNEVLITYLSAQI